MESSTADLRPRMSSVISPSEANEILFQGRLAASWGIIGVSGSKVEAWKFLGGRKVSRAANTGSEVGAGVDHPLPSHLVCTISATIERALILSQFPVLCKRGPETPLLISIHPLIKNYLCLSNVVNNFRLLWIQQ